MLLGDDLNWSCRWLVATMRSIGHADPFEEVVGGSTCNGFGAVFEDDGEVQVALLLLFAACPGAEGYDAQRFGVVDDAGDGFVDSALGNSPVEWLGGGLGQGGHAAVDCRVGRG